jgi:[protein-PII] uridylyltransferase
VLRAALDATFATLPARLLAPGTGGAVCRAISDLYDAAIGQRFAEARAGVAAPLALVATGGWARRELAPYSDIDFIVLHERDEASAKQVADKLLYPLWDEKLAIGHAIREAKATAKLAREDLATATALLDARHIAGERRLSTDLERATLGALAPGGNPNDFIAMLAAEQKGRHERFGASIYLLEPNLKQGIGALRDLSTALWAAQVRWHPPRPGEDPETTESLIGNLVAMSHLTRRQGDVLANARDFLLRVRALVQLTAKRRFDQLTFEVQEALGPRLYPDARPHEGDIRSAVAPAVEALMQDYYLHARQVLQVTDHLLDAARVPGRKKPRVTQVDASFITVNGELAVKDPQVFRERPSEMVRLFRVAVAEQLPIAAHTRELIADAVSREPQAIGSDPAAASLVLDALVDIRDAAQPSALEQMHQLGILSAVMPEWAPCTARVQHDLYHVYTVDQHQLYAVAMQKRIARGELAAEHPLATELWKDIARPAPLLLGTLLHDVGKPLGKGHAEKGAVITRHVAARLGMNDADGELAEFLVRQHLTMSHLSQRRDLADPEVIARFAERIGDDEHLVQLYLVTLCDTAMTAPDNLNAWKDGLLRDLLLRTREVFHAGGRDAIVDADAEARDKAVQLASEGDAMTIEAARAAVAGIDPRLFTQLTPRQSARQVRLAVAAQGKRPAVAIEVHCFPMKGHSELAIVAPDAPGTLAAIAGALTASRIDVLGAMLGHIDLEQRLILDTFYVRDLKGEAIAEDDPRWTRLVGDLRELLAGKPDQAAVEALIAKRRPKSALPPRVTPGVPTEIRIHDDSTQATIVEVFTRDRAGVLYAITHTLAELGLDISLAKVSTEGEKVADVFYVTRGGKRLTDPSLREALVERLRVAAEVP